MHISYAGKEYGGNYTRQLSYATEAGKRYLIVNSHYPGSDGTMSVQSGGNQLFMYTDNTTASGLGFPSILFAEATDTTMTVNFTEHNGSTNTLYFLIDYVRSSGTTAYAAVNKGNGVSFTIPANTLNGDTAYVICWADQAHNQLSHTTSSGVLTLVDWTYNDYSGGSRYGMYVYTLTGYNKASDITILGGYSSAMYNLHIVLN